MSYEELIHYEKRNKIGIITLNRPNKLNAFNPIMIETLHDIWHQIEQDTDVKVAIITGNGSSFSSGMDIKNQSPVESIIPGIGVEVTKPIIAAIDGYCIGLGLVLALKSDIRITTEEATFVYPEAKIGYTRGVGSLLAKYIPLGIAMEMLLSGEGITAERAYELGFVNHIVTKDKLMNKAINVAENIADNAPMVVKVLKELALNPDIAENNGARNLIVSPLSTSYDRQEGAKAFMEKRQPNFLGK